MCVDLPHFGVQVARRAWLQSDRAKRWIGKVYPLLPLQQKDIQALTEGWVYGTMELQHMGGHRLGNGLKKQIQLYPILHHLRACLSKVEPTWHSHKYDILNKQEALRRLSDLMLASLAKGGGGRKEFRLRASEGVPSRLSGVVQGVDSQEYVRDCLNRGTISLFKVPLGTYQRCLEMAWGNAAAADCFRGQPQQPPSYDELSHYVVLLAQLGFASGRWSRTVLQFLRGPAQVRRRRIRQVVSPEPAEPEAAGDGAAGPGDEELRALLARAPNLAPSPVEPFIEPLPADVGMVAMEDLGAEAVVILRYIPESCVKSGKPRFFYINGWGPPHLKIKCSPGYLSRPALARAPWTWAGCDWHRRVKNSIPA